MNGMQIQDSSLDTALPPDARPPTRGKVCNRTLRRLLQLLGGVVCMFFASQGIFIWLDGPKYAFWVICHWLGEGSLYLIVGLCGLYLEMRVFFPDIYENRKFFAFNRLGLAFGYLWVGCYTAGGHVQEIHEIWELFGRITAVLAWLVSAGDVCIACCSDYEAPLPLPLKDPEKNSFIYEVSEELDSCFCKNCGLGMDVGNKYCPACGTRFQADDMSANPFVEVRIEDESNPFAQDAAAFAALTTRDASKEKADESALSLEDGSKRENIPDNNSEPELPLAESAFPIPESVTLK